METERCPMGECEDEEGGKTEAKREEKKELCFLTPHECFISPANRYGSAAVRAETRGVLLFSNVGIVDPLHE